jgi:hypothetical protein
MRSSRLKLHDIIKLYVRNVPYCTDTGENPGAQRLGGTALDKRQDHKCRADRSDEKADNRAEERAEDRAELGAAMLWIRIQIQWFRRYGI